MLRAALGTYDTSRSAIADLSPPSLGFGFGFAFPSSFPFLRTHYFLPRLTATHYNS